MLKIRRPLGRLIFNMGIAITGKTVFLIETAPRIIHVARAMLSWSWWRYQMEALSALLALCGGNPSTKASDAELWCFLWCAPEQTFEKKLRSRLFETPSNSLSRHCNDYDITRRRFPNHWAFWDESTGAMSSQRFFYAGFYNGCTQFSQGGGAFSRIQNPLISDNA